MKKLTALVLTLVMLASVLVLPAFADSDKVDTLPHNHRWRHKQLMLWDCPESTYDYPRGLDVQMTAQELEDCVAANRDLIPEDCNVRAGRLTMVESREITCGEAPFTVTFRVWGTKLNPVMVFFKGPEDTEWSMLACCMGTDITAEFPCDGMYAVAKAW